MKQPEAWKEFVGGESEAHPAYGFQEELYSLKQERTFF